MPTIQQVRTRTIATAVALSMAVTAAVALMLPTAPASADPFAGCYGASNAEGCLPDDFNHTYCFSGFFDEGLRAAFLGAMGNLHSDTDYFIEFVESCDNLTDIIVFEDVTVDRGAYQCIIANAAGNCERAHIGLNLANLPTPEDRTKTSCHEIGHSVGLKHGINRGPSQDNDSYLDCMRSGDIVAGQDINDYDAHHTQHINDRA